MCVNIVCGSTLRFCSAKRFTLICFSLSRFLSLSICLSLSVCLSLSIYLSVFLAVFVVVCPSICLFVCLSMYLSRHSDRETVCQAKFEVQNGTWHEDTCPVYIDHYLPLPTYTTRWSTSLHPPPPPTLPFHHPPSHHRPYRRQPHQDTSYSGVISSWTSAARAWGLVVINLIRVMHVWWGLFSAGRSSGPASAAQVFVGWMHGWGGVRYVTGCGRESYFSFPVNLIVNVCMIMNALSTMTHSMCVYFTWLVAIRRYWLIDIRDRWFMIAQPLTQPHTVSSHTLRAATCRVKTVSH